MKLEKLIKIANALADNTLSMTRYNTIWKVDAYRKGFGEKHRVEAEEIREAVIGFIESFGLKVEKPKGKKK